MWSLQLGGPAAALDAYVIPSVDRSRIPQFEFGVRRSVQVMKMFMPLLSPAAGTLHHVLPEGSLLNAGDLIARHAQDSRCIAIASMPADECFTVLSMRLWSHAHSLDCPSLHL